MKSYTDLWAEITSWPNLLRAAYKARKRKRRRPNVARFQADLEPEVAQLRVELLNKTYRPGVYKTFHIHSPKRRLISAAPYRDRVVHHALCNVVEPLFERRFISDTYANREDKGTHAALRRYAQFVRRYRYVLRGDIKKYFPSMDHEVLLKKLRRVVRCPDTRWLIGMIVRGSNAQEPVLDYFHGDDLFAPLERRRGLPIGNQTSQFFGNVYLDAFDHFVKEVLRLPYLRYVDDFAVFGNSKGHLVRALAAMARALAQDRLKLHPKKTRIYQCRDGTSFVGYRVFPDRIRLPRENLRRLNKRMRAYRRAFELGRLSVEDVTQRVRSWLGHARHANAIHLVQKLFDGHVFVRAPGCSGRACCAAAPGTTTQGTADLQIATGTNPITATTTSGFG